MSKENIQVMITKNQVKYIQSLSQKKFRDEESVFVAEGPKIIVELLTMANMHPAGIYGTDEWWAMHPEWQTADWANEIQEAELERISFLKAPNQVLGIFRKPALNMGSGIAPGGWQLLLDGIQDPGNLGTLLRIADWFGIKQVICSEDTADVYNPKVIQSSMASVGRVGVIYTNLAAYVQANPDRHFYAAVLGGTSLKNIQVQGACSLVIGNESKGIRPDLMQELKEFITIPRIGEAESLNAAVAAGIILSHLVS